MSEQFTYSQTPIPAGNAVQILLTVRGNKSLYGYVYGPFRYDEERGCFVYHRPDKKKSYSIEEWQAQGDALLVKLARYRPNVRVEIVPAEVPVEAAVIKADHFPDATKMAAPTAPADPVEAPAPDPLDEAAPAPVKRTRKTVTSAE